MNPSRLLLLVAALLALGTAGFWAAKGAHRGWSQNKVPVKAVDEVTGLEHVTYEDRYVPGVDFLGGGLALAGAVAGASLFLRKKNNSQP
jgi:hypothetical protein